MIDDRIKELIKKVVLSEGMELVQIEFKPGANSFLRIFIDKPGGVTLDDCQDISEQVSAMLDVEDPIPHSYVLEVSSPGLDRQLFTEADFRKFLGRKVKVKTKVDISGRRFFNGRIVHTENGVVSLEEAKRLFQIPIEVIEKANLEVEFEKRKS